MKRRASSILKAGAAEAMKRFLKVVVPVLLQDHWPDWEEVLRVHASQVDKKDAKD